MDIIVSPPPPLPLSQRDEANGEARGTAVASPPAAAASNLSGNPAAGKLRSVSMSKLAIFAASIAGASALSFESIWSGAGVPLNSTSSKVTPVGSVKSCNTANALAKNFVVTITNDAGGETFKAGDTVHTHFIYVRAPRGAAETASEDGH